MSEAVAGGGVSVVCLLLAHSMVIGAGQEIEGGVVSTTVMVVLQPLVLPTSSLAVNVSVVEPSGNDCVPAGPVTLRSPGFAQMSVAVAMATVAGALWLPVHSRVCGGAQVIEGGVVSTTDTVV